MTIKSEGESQLPLSEVDWLIFESSGFKTEEEGRIFGEKLRQALHMAGVCCRVGLDARNYGDNQKLSDVNPEIISAIYGESCNVLPDVHGITVFRDDNDFIPPIQGCANLKGGRNADIFTQVLQEIFSKNSENVSGSESIQMAIRVLNLADASSDSIAKLVLSVSTVEGLAKEPKWTTEQTNRIDWIVESIENGHEDIEGAEMVISAIKEIRSRVSVGRRVKHLWNHHNLSELLPEWDKIYKKRSRLFHRDSKGNAPAGNLEDSELCALSEDAFKLCTTIILTIAYQSGIFVPQRAATSFDLKLL